MKKILFAYLFLLLDLEIVMNRGYFSLLLPLCGVSLLVCGFAELASENEHFEQCSTYAMGLAMLRGFLFFAQWLELLWVERAYVVFASIGVIVLFLVTTHRMLCVFREIEEENNLFMASRFCVIGEGCLCLVALGCVWGSASPTLGGNFMLLSALASGLFLLALYQLKVVYVRFEKA